jgi:hypothetical protein
MIVTDRAQFDTPEIGAPASIRLAGSIVSAIVEHKKPGRRHKGDRRQVNTRQPRVLAEAAEAEAARCGITLTDLIGTLLAERVGLTYELQEALPTG